MIWGYLIEFHGLCVNASGHFNALQAGLGFTAPARLSSINYCNCWIGQLQGDGENPIGLTRNHGKSVSLVPRRLRIP